MVPSHIGRSPMPWALMHHHTITEAGFCTFQLVTVCMFFIHLWHVESDICFSQKQAEMWTCLTRVHVSTVFQSISDYFCAQIILAVFLHKINKCLPLCVIQFQVAFLDAAADCFECQWFPKVLPSLCGYVHPGTITVSQTIPLDSLDGHTHSAAVGWSLPWPLRTDIDISPDSLNLFTILGKDNIMIYIFLAFLGSVLTFMGVCMV